MSNFIAIVYTVVLFWESPNPVTTLLALNPLEKAGLAVTIGWLIAEAIKAWKGRM